MCLLIYSLLNRDICIWLAGLRGNSLYISTSSIYYYLLLKYDTYIPKYLNSSKLKLFFMFINTNIMVKQRNLIKNLNFHYSDNWLVCEETVHFEIKIILILNYISEDWLKNFFMFVNFCRLNWIKKFWHILLVKKCNQTEEKIIWII